MNEHITASLDTLMGQASATAGGYLEQAAEYLSSQQQERGKAWTPGDAVALAAIMAQDFATSATLKIQEEFNNKLIEKLGNIAQALEGSK